MDIDLKTLIALGKLPSRAREIVVDVCLLGRTPFAVASDINQPRKRVFQVLELAINRLAKDPGWQHG
jgi:DNA-directed RNA polymerase specialized sigma24 family protein